MMETICLLERTLSGSAVDAPGSARRVAEDEPKSMEPGRRA